MTYERNTVPFYTTKAGVRIGCAYQPPPPRPWREEELVQRAVLVKVPDTPPRTKGLLRRIIEVL